jgi:ABC-2 type transport system ATP-binding protein
MSQPIVVSGLTKIYPKVTAVNDLSFTVEPGRVTGFLGPNGSGKTTTLRMIVGLVNPTHGEATIGTKRYAELDRPLSMVGTLLEASSAHKGRTAINHLRILCASAGYPEARAYEALEMVGLTPVAKRPFRSFSLGMRQRLGVAAAMIGDPRVLILDEPANGLDPEGIRWMREFLRALASQGRTVFVSSHLLAEIEQLADELIIIAYGRMVAHGRTAQIVATNSRVSVKARTSQPQALVEAIRRLGVVPQVDSSGAVLVTGLEPEAVGRAALEAQVVLSELTSERPDLEQVFLQLTHGMAGLL